MAVCLRILAVSFCLLLGGFGFAATSAQAGQYDLQQCYFGNNNSSQMTYNTFDGRYAGSPLNGTCISAWTSVGVSIDWGSSDDNASPSSANFSISAPSGTSFTSLSWDQKLSGQGGGTRCVYVTDASASLVGSSDCLTNSFTYYDGPWNSQSQSTSTSSLFFTTGCVASTCNGGTSNQLIGYFRDINARLTDNTAPALSGKAGLINQTGWVRGSWPLSWQSSDGMGIKINRWSLDGIEQANGGLLCNPSYNGYTGVFYGTLQDGCPSPSNASFTVDTTAMSSGSHTVAISSYDLTSNDGSSSTSLSVDNSAPSTPSLSGPSQYTNDDTPTFSFSSSDDQSGVAGYECSLSGGGYFACTSSYTTSPLPDGSHSFCVKAKNNALDSSGNPAYSDPECIVFATSTVPPTASFSSQPGNPTNVATLDYNLQFSAGITGLSTSDFVVGGTSTGCTPSVSGADDSWTFSLAGCSEGTVTVSLNQDSVTDVYGNIGPAAPLGASSVTIDRTRPTAYWTEPESPVTTTSMDYTLVFYEAVTGIASGDFSYTGTATGCSITPSSPGGIAVTVTVSGCSNGTFTLKLNANTVSDAAGNIGPSSARVAAQVLIDHDGPVGSWTEPVSPTNQAVLNYTLDLDEPTTSISNSDFDVLGTATGCSVAVTGSSGTSFPVSLSGCSEGTVILRLKANSLTDALGNTGPASNTDASTITIDRTAPAVSSWVTPSSPQISLPISFDINFSEDISGLSSSDFSNQGTAEGCSFTTSSSSGSSLTVTVDDCGPGTVKLRLAAGSISDAAGNSGPAAYSESGSLTYGVPLANVSLPALSTPALASLVLSVGNGSWSGSEPVSFAYAWFRCDASSPTSCTTIPGATSATYTPVASDVGFKLKAQVTATNLLGSLAAESAVSPVVGLPEVTLTKQPAWPAREVSFEWTGISGASFECRLDQGSFAPCISPYSIPSGLADGTHSFSIRQSLSGQDSPLKTVDFKLDRTAPSAPSLLQYPQAKTTLTSAEIVFSGEEGATFECRFDSEAFAACTSPVSRSGLSLGNHSFSVRQVDLAGNSSPAADVSWQVTEQGGGGDDSGAKVITTDQQKISVGRGSVIIIGCGVKGAVFTLCSSRTYVLRRAKGSKEYRRVFVGNASAQNTSQLGSIALRVKLNKRGRHLLSRSRGPLKVRTMFTVQLQSGRTIKGYMVSWLIPPRQLIAPSTGMFRTGSAAIAGPGRKFLYRLSRRLPDRTKRIVCTGYTDSVGSSVDNYWLGLRRAKAVCAYLRSSGLRSSFRARSYGAARPRATNKTAEGRRLNRRVELRVIYR